MSERLLLDITKVELTDDGESVGEPVGRRLVPLLDIVGPPVGFPNRPDPAALRAIRREILRGARWPGVIVAVLSTIFALAACATLVPIVWRQAWGQSWIFVGAIVILLVVYDRLLLPIFRRPYRRVYTRACLAHNLCPFCLYQLPEGDSSSPVRCPECGGYWRRSHASS